jgi:hypothetical protein
MEEMNRLIVIAVTLLKEPGLGTTSCVMIGLGFPAIVPVFWTLIQNHFSK